MTHVKQYYLCFHRSGCLYGCRPWLRSVPILYAMTFVNQSTLRKDWLNIRYTLQRNKNIVESYVIRRLYLHKVHSKFTPPGNESNNQKGTVLVWNRERNRTLKTRRPNWKKDPHGKRRTTTFEDRTTQPEEDICRRKRRTIASEDRTTQ